MISQQLYQTGRFMVAVATMILAGTHREMKVISSNSPGCFHPLPKEYSLYDAHLHNIHIALKYTLLLLWYTCYTIKGHWMKVKLHPSVAEFFLLVIRCL